MPDNPVPLDVQFHYIKSNFFRVLHVDGMIGGPTPAGLIFLSLYNERGAIPQITVHDVTEGGEVGPERMNDRVTKQGIVREVEVGLIMSVETATSVVAWLQEKIDVAKKMRAAMEAEGKSNESSVH